MRQTELFPPPPRRRTTPPKPPTLAEMLREANHCRRCDKPLGAGTCRDCVGVREFEDWGKE